jgi:UDP-glucose 4-epimerase
MVTGGCGFIGRNLVRSLLADPATAIYVIDDLSMGRHPSMWLDAKLVDQKSPTRLTYRASSGAIATFCFESVAKTLLDLDGTEPSGGQFFTWDEVYHLAACVGGRLSLEYQPLKIAANLATDATFFSWVSHHADRIGRVLYMSSSAAYPLRLQRAETFHELCESMTDEMPVMDTDGVYGWSKLTGEYLARTVAAKYGLRVCCVRPFSGYGPDQGLSYPVPAIAARVASRDDPLLVWGPGTQVRDFIYISDCIAGMQHAMARISDGSAVNLGTGTGTTLADVARTLARIAGYEPRVSTDPAKPVGASVRVADVRKMRHILDWQPETDLENGLRLMLGGLER